jgi:hypothetical protein
LHTDNQLEKARLHIAQFITLIVALQILNMGLFVQDFQYNVSSSICDQNIINSVVEYVSEVVLKKNNAMPEDDNNTHKDYQAHKHTILKLIELEMQSLAFTAPINTETNKAPLKENYYFQFCKEINPPPPKA